MVRLFHNLILSPFFFSGWVVGWMAQASRFGFDVGFFGLDAVRAKADAKLAGREVFRAGSKQATQMFDEADRVPHVRAN